MQLVYDLIPWWLRNLGRFEKTTFTDDYGNVWDSYRFLKDCDCNGKKFLSGRLRPTEPLLINNPRRHFWSRQSWWEARLGVFEVLLADVAFSIPNAMQALVFKQIDRLMFLQVHDGIILDRHERELVGLELEYAIAKKRHYAEEKKKIERWFVKMRDDR